MRSPYVEVSFLPAPSGHGFRFGKYSVSDNFIRLDNADDMPIISVVGDVDIANAHILDQAIAVFDVEKAVVVSFEDCSYLDSSALSVPVNRNKELEGNLVVVVDGAGAAHLRYAASTRRYASSTRDATGSLLQSA